MDMRYSEAKERAYVHKGRIAPKNAAGEYRVTLNEWRGREAEEQAYYSDDLLDCVITLGRMRQSNPL